MTMSTMPALTMAVPAVALASLPLLALPGLDTVRDSVDPATLLNICGFVVGLLFGVIAEMTAFCTRAAIVETLDRTPDKPRLRLVQYLAALFTALVIAQTLAVTGTVDLGQSLYWSVPVNPGALVIGGLAFGCGMILANGCPGRHLVLMATGSARSLLTLTVLGLASYATLRGILAYPRMGVEAIGPAGLLPVGLPQLLNVPAGVLAGGLALALAGGTFWLARRTGPVAVLGGAGVGAVIGLGWWATGSFAVDEMNPTRPASISFTAPIGETIVYLLIFTGETLKFNVALVAGVLVGAFASSVLGRRFSVRGFTTELSVLRYGGGAVLMGFGAVLALGCNMGQALTGLSTLATGSLIASIAIVAGACLTLALQKRVSAPVEIPSDVGHPTHRVG